MRNFCRRFPFRFELKPAGTLWALALMGALMWAAPASRAQTPPPGGEFKFALAGDFAMESDGFKRVMIVRSAPARGNVTVDLVVADDPDGFGAGITTTTVAFRDYQMSATVDVPITDNTDAEPVWFGTITLGLENPAVAPGEDAGLTPTIANGTQEMALDVYDNDEALFFHVEKSEVAVSEGGSFQFTVTLAGNPGSAGGQNVSVGYEVYFLNPNGLLAGTATASPSDVVLASGRLSFGDNDVSQRVTIDVSTDNLIEFDETFGVRLIDPQGTAPEDPADPMSPRIDYDINPLFATRARILFNGAPDQPQPPGAVDQNFNAENQPPLNLQSPGALGPVTAVAVDVDNLYYIAGNFPAVNSDLRPGVARLLSDGSVDPGFAPTGLPNGSVNALAVYNAGADKGKVLVGGGFSAISGLNRNGIARFLANGQVDTAFNPGQGANGPVYAVALGLDGSIIIGGEFTAYNGVPRGNIARLRPNGSLDPNAFNGEGANGPVYGLALQEPAPFTFSGAVTGDTNEMTFSRTVPGQSGTLLLTFDPWVEEDQVLVRFGNTTVFNGTVSTNYTIVTDPNTGAQVTNSVPTTMSFDLGPVANPSNPLTIVVNPGNATNSTSWSFDAVVTPASTLSIVAMGDFTEVDGAPHGRIARFNGLGQLDATFSQRIGLGADGPINAGAFQSDGKLVIGGEFNDFNGIPMRGVARLLPDGTADETFAVGTGADGAVLTVAVDKRAATRDQIYIGGQFRSYNSTRRIFLARLLPNGPLDTSFLDTAYNQYAGFPDFAGFQPFGVISGVAVAPGGEVFVGGIFDAVGGGDTRASVKPRQNFARLIGGSLPGPGNIQFTQASFGAAENGGTMSVNLERVNGRLGGAVVGIMTEEGSAIDPEDYTGGASLLDFAAGNNPLVGANSFTYAITIADDAEIEGQEEFYMLFNDLFGNIQLAGEVVPTGVAFGAPVEAIGRIIDNDVVPAVLQFSAAEYDIDETRSFATIEVRRTGNVLNRVTVQAVAAQPAPPNAATDLVDFRAVTNTLTFAPNITTATFQVPIIDDQPVELEEKVTLYLTNAFNAQIDATRGQAALNIIDNDLESGRVDFAAVAYSVDENGTNAVLQVRRRGGSVGTIAVDYATEPGTALEGTDFIPTTGRLVWNNADISVKTILIPIVDDQLREVNELFRVRLKNPVPGGVIGVRNPTTVTIRDNDAYGQFSFATPQFYADENGVNAVITVVRREGSAETVTVNYTAAAGTAVADTDFSPVSGTLTFGPGVTSQSFSVPVIDDAANPTADGNKTVTLTLSNPVNGTIAAGQGTATLTLVDNETLNIPAGSVETDFAVGAGANGPVNAVVIQNDQTDADRRIIIAGDFTQYNVQNRQRIARLLDDGSLDRRYALNLQVNGSIKAAAPVMGDKLMIGGAFTRINDTPMNYLARLNNAGQLDLLFNPGSGADNWVYAVAETFSGTGADRVSKVVVGGDFITFNAAPRQRIAVLNADGSVDTTFNPGSGANGTVLAVAVQRDGKILIGGEFTSVAGQPRTRIARLNANGSLDLTFSADAAPDGAVRTIEVALDDKILIGGDFRSVTGLARGGIARLNVDGTLDGSFGTGLAGANGTVYDIEVQPDGNLVVGGEFTLFNANARNRIARLLPDGAVDTSINFGAGANGYVAAIALQADRKIVLGGNFTTFDNQPRNRVARVYGGSLGGSGTVAFERGFYSVEESAGTVTLFVRREGGTSGELRAQFDVRVGTAQPFEDYIPLSGELVFAPGESIRTISVPLLDDNIAEDVEFFAVELIGAPEILGRQPFATVELVSDDSVLSFTDSEYVASEIVPGGVATISVQRVGESSTPVTVTYRTVAGTATAGSDYSQRNGQLTFNPGETLKSFNVPILDDAIVEGDETVLLQLSNPSANATISTVQATLTISDNDFAPGRISFSAAQTFVDETAGSVTVTVTRTSGRTGSVAVQYATANGTATAGEDYTATSGTVLFLEGETTKTVTIPVADDSRVEGNEAFSVALTNPTGGALLTSPSTIQVVIADSDFGAGSLDPDFNIGTGANAPIASVYIQPDDRIVIGGDFTSFNNANRQYVARLTADGPVDPDFDPGIGPDNVVNSVARADAFGNVAIGGAFRAVASQDRLYVARLTASGALDATMSRSAGLNADVNAMAVQANGNVVVGGNFTTPARGVARITRDGALDASFNVGTGANATGVPNVRAVAVGENGRVFVGGGFTEFSGIPRAGLVALRADGSVDPAFVPPAQAGTTVYEIVPVQGGKVLVAGAFAFAADDGARRNVARLNADGTVDTTFAAINADQPVYAVGVQADGKIVLGGDFTQINGVNRSRIARLNADGTLDLTFDPGQGANDSILDLAIEPDGQIVIVGEFTTVNGFPRAYIARLNNDTAPPAEPINITVTREASDLVINFTSQAGVDYELLGSIDLLTWAPIRPVASQGANTTVRVTIPDTAGYQFFVVRRTTP